MCGKTRKDRIKNVRFREYLGDALIGDEKKNSFEMVWRCLMQTSKNNNKEKFFYAGWRPTKGKRLAIKDIDGSSNNRSRKVQPIRGFSSR